jgi:multicomponent Na+:H+ antiporter subunit G
MSYNYIELISLVLLAIGCFFILSGSLGLIKLPDVFSRIHAAGLIYTLGSGFIVLALIVYSGFSLLSLKLLLIPLFLIFTSPVTGHAIALFAHESGYKPKGKNKK